MQRVCWADDRLVGLDEPVVRGDDSAFAEGRGCYTTVRIQAGRPRHVERHWRRLERGVRALDLAPLDERRFRHALDTLAAAAFPDGEGVVRLQASRDGSGRTHLTGVPRPLGDDRPAWTARVVATDPSMALPGGHKLSNRLALTLAAEVAAGHGDDEALILDARGRLVEGARSNILVARPDGRLVTPPLDRGAVSGVMRQLVMERVEEIAERDVHRSALDEAREIIAVNAVRGARPITRVDGRPVGRGRPGPWYARVTDAIATE
jgi:branched-subunit amino acid aminotransferase/4-amino-4-deoxychorismate lyase